ncbi:hypothetical protein FRB98_007737 [Tulasnella sp. 332]|nr:hypothetical protein FRB98_007737 [Tulasnella sp. 332]
MLETADRFGYYCALLTVILVLTSVVLKFLTPVLFKNKERKVRIIRPRDSVIYTATKPLRVAPFRVITNPASTSTARPSTPVTKQANRPEPALFKIVRTRHGEFKSVKRTNRDSRERWMNEMRVYFSHHYNPEDLMAIAHVETIEVEAPTFTPVRPAYQTHRAATMLSDGTVSVTYNCRRTIKRSATGKESIVYESKARTTVPSRLGACSIVAAPYDSAEDDENDAMEDIIYHGLPTYHDVSTDQNSALVEVEEPTFTVIKSAYQPQRVATMQSDGTTCVYYQSETRRAGPSRLGSCSIVAASHNTAEDDESDAMEDIIYHGLAVNTAGA